jgi:PAS domain S-box-containing protein
VEASVRPAPPVAFETEMPELTGPPEALASRMHVIAGVLSLTVFAAAAAVMAGWALGVPWLRRPLPNLEPMKANTAVALLLTSASLWLHRSGRSVTWRDALREYFAAVAGLLLLLTLIEYATHWTYVDQLFFLDPTGPTRGTPPGRIPFSATVSLILVEAALLVGGRPQRYGLAQCLVAAATILATLDVVTYFFGTDVLEGLEPFATMELHTSAALLMLCVGFVLAKPDQGAMKVVIDAGPGGLVIRRLLPVIFFLPLLLASLSLQGIAANWYQPGFAMAIFVVLMISGLSTAVWAGGRVLQSLEAKRLAAEQLRHQSEERLRRAVADAPVPIAIHDDAERILHVSRGWIDLSGFSTEETPTTSVWAALARPESTEEAAALQQLITGGDEPRAGESAIRTRKGATRIWDFSTTPLGTMGAERRAFVTMAIDVTERKQAESDLRRMNESLEQRIADRTAQLTRANEALKRQSEQLREQAALLDLTRDGILVRDLHGTIIYWSAGAAEMYGFSATEAIGAVSHKLLGPIYPRPLAEIEKQVMDSGHWEGDLIHTTRSGARLSIEGRWTLTRTDRGVPQGFLEVNRDATARRRAQDSLRDSEMRFRAVSETANDAIVTVNEQGLVQYWNPGAARMFGWPAGEAVGQPVTLFAPERMRPEHETSVTRYLSTPEAHDIGKTLELTGLRQDGTEFPVEVSLSSWQSTQGKVFIGLLRDITDRKRAERLLEAKADELSRSNEELEQFAYVASHDLQEPLRMVSNYTQLLARRYRDHLDEDADEFIDFAVDGAKRMQALIHDLLQYARLGTRGKEFRPVSGATVVDDALANLAGAIDEAGATIEVGPLPMLTCDGSQLAQVFQNLVGNAIKFRRPDTVPAVRIWAVDGDDGWTLSVADNGIGIEPRFFDRIFQMFQRLHGRAEYPGTGIGLALCKKIVERHGGRIRVSSEFGTGTTFSFTIPHAARP